MTHLDPSTADKLAKVCGLFGSAHDGERAAAAAKADKLIKERGLSWSDLLASTPALSSDAMIAYAIRHGDDVLSCWEWGFLHGIRGRQYLTERQLTKLGHVFAKVKARTV
jgi:hypothetical protein